MQAEAENVYNSEDIEDGLQIFDNGAKIGGGASMRPEELVRPMTMAMGAAPPTASGCKTRRRRTPRRRHSARRQRASAGHARSRAGTLSSRAAKARGRRPKPLTEAWHNTWAGPTSRLAVNCRSDASRVVTARGWCHWSEPWAFVRASWSERRGERLGVMRRSRPRSRMASGRIKMCNRDGSFLCVCTYSSLKTFSRRSGGDMHMYGRPPTHRERSLESTHA